MTSDGTKKTKAKGIILLLLCSMIWGSSFAAQAVGMESVEAFTFLAIRTLFGAAFLFPVILIKDAVAAKRSKPVPYEVKKKERRKLLTYGLLLGLVFEIAQIFQQYAFLYSTSGKIAFITALYMFFTPIFGLFLKKRVPLLTWISVMIGFVGLYFLCINPADLADINRGDILSFICSMFYGVQILMVERFARETDGIKLSFTQFFVAGVISAVLMLIFDTPTIPHIRTALPALLYSGIMSCGFAYTFQILGQKYTEATIASLLMSLESVFAVLTGALVLHERMTGREALGCVIMFAAILLSQAPAKKRA